ncbi:MAG: hypothetical protein H0V17_28265, partial [Deltaproteobacteria bacterium]|nr:hypothetical protein [Deltaproteobacteria bacterium]
MWRVAHEFPLAGSPMHGSSIATIVRTSSGDLAICNPVGFDDAIARQITELGPVRWILAQGKAHSSFVEPARRRFQGSLSIASEGHLRHPPAGHLVVDGVLGRSTLPDELGLIPIAGHLFEEVMILDRPSRTLISQDVVAFSADERTFLSRLYTFAFGIVDPLGFPSLSLMLWQNMSALHGSFAALRDADFGHVIAAHGPITPRSADVAALHATLEHARGITPLAHKAMLARYFASQPGFLRDLLRYLKSSKGKRGARLRESTQTPSDSVA